MWMKYSITGLLICSLLACNAEYQNSTANYVSISGKTMGTIYNIVFKDVEGQVKKHQAAIDSILVAFNEEVSTYIPNSIISKVNQDTTLQIKMASLSEDGGTKVDNFIANIDLAEQFYEDTDGYMDATLMPLVNYWGFGYTEKKAVDQVDSMQIDAMLQLVGMDKVEFKDDIIYKSNPNISFDFSAFAKGYGVDLIGKYFESQGVVDFLVEIGGETLGRGLNKTAEPWKVGINTPKADASINDFQVIVQLDELAVATSGNYRIFYENEVGDRYAHIINPRTGFSETSNLLSASVFAADCATADAYATAFMVMGLEAAMEKVEQEEGLEACLIYINDKEDLEVFFSSGMDDIKLID